MDDIDVTVEFKIHGLDYKTAIKEELQQFVGLPANKDTKELMRRTVINLLYEITSEVEVK